MMQMKKRKFKDLSDAELYMVKRAFIESSAEIGLNGFYNDAEVKIHGMLLNEIIEELKYRDLHCFDPIKNTVVKPGDPIEFTEELKCDCGTES